MSAPVMNFVIYHVFNLREARSLQLPDAVFTSLNACGEIVENTSFNFEPDSSCLTAQ